MAKFVSEEKRTKRCGEIRSTDIGQKVVLMGWVETRRDLGGMVFVDLRDRDGIVQVVLDPAQDTTKFSKDVRNEYVLALKGEVRARPDGMINKKIPTGDVEVVAEVGEVLAESKPLPIQISDPNLTENMALKYRYLDLRSSRLQKNMHVRHRFHQIVRRVLDEEGFWEIETPILYKSTPEGARDYLVPSRVSPGKFYALPQSPQTLKQLLMIGGYDRYFQIARCFRDEDLRADRQPEFTQLDVEMSFVDVDDLISLNEKIVRTLWKEILDIDVEEIPRISYQESMDRFGTDSPDMRFGMELKDLNATVKGSGFKVFDDSVALGGSVKGIGIPKGDAFSRGKFDKLTKEAKQMGAKGLVWMKSNVKGEISSPIAKFLAPEKLKEIFEVSGGKPGDAVVVVADDFEVTCPVLGHLRLELAKEQNLIPKDDYSFVWVLNFPLLEYDADDKRWIAKHHPFTSPSEESMDHLLKGDEGTFKDMTAKAYDLVCNGHEIAGGSIRIHRQEVQKAMFRTLGMSEKEADTKFGFFIEALQYGTPPHGGIAWGADRTVMLLCGTDAIREVIAFPKTTKAICQMSQAPSLVDLKQLEELGISLTPEASENLEGDAGSGEEN